MSTEFTLICKHTPISNSDTAGATITYRFETESLPQVLSMLQDFIKSSGFVVDGRELALVPNFDLDDAE